MKITEFLKSRTAKEFLRYVLVGGAAFLVDAGVLALFYRFILPDFSLELGLFSIADGRTVTATAIGFIFGLAANYLLSIIFVFNSSEQKKRGNSVKAFLIYAAVGLVGLGLTEAGMLLGVGLLGDRFLLPVKIVVAGIVLVWNYIGRKIFVYRGK